MNNNLMFWVEWVKLTTDQRIQLLNHITDDDMLYEIAVTSARLISNDLIDGVVYRMKDDTMVVKLAAEVLPRCAESIVDRLGKSAWMLFDNDATSILMACDDDAVTEIIRNMDLNELSVHCSSNICPTIRACAFDNVVLRMTHDVDNIDEYNQYLSFLQKMIMTEPNDHIRERMQGMLDDLTEDRI